MELVFGDKLQLICMKFIGQRDLKILSEAIFVKEFSDNSGFYYHLPEANPKVVLVSTHNCIVTVNDKPYK